MINPLRYSLVEDWKKYVKSQEEMLKEVGEDESYNNCALYVMVKNSTDIMHRMLNFIEDMAKEELK